MRKFIVILLAAVVAVLPIAVMSPAHAAAYQVTASISTSSAQSGDGPVVTGSISPATPGKVVYLQRYYSGAWHTLDTTTTDGAGQYSKHLSNADLNYKIGALKFRAKVVGSGSYSSGASSTVTKTIYGWQSLAYMDATYGDSRRFVDGNSWVTIDGNFADDGWRTDNPPVGTVGTRYTKWNLQEKCIRLRGFAGIDDDDSDVGAVGRFILSLDGTANDYARDFSLGQVEFVDRQLHKTQYLAVKAYRQNSIDTAVGFGEPEVLCSKYLPQDY